MSLTVHRAGAAPSAKPVRDPIAAASEAGRAATILTESFGMAVRQLRDEKGWSQERLSEAADLNRSYVGEIERGAVVVSLVTLDKLALALGLGPHALVEHCERVRQLRLVRGLQLSSISY